MTSSTTFKYSLICAAALSLAACSAPEQAVQPINPKGGTATPVQMPNSRSSESSSQTVNDYMLLQSTLDAAKQGDDAAPAQFLSRQSDSAMGESVRNEWLKSLGSRGQWSLFQQQYAKLAPQGRSLETRCYADYLAVTQGQRSSVTDEVVQETGRQPQGCNVLLEEAARRGQLDSKAAWRRVRGLISNNQITDARNLAAALGSPLDGGSGQGAQENLLQSVIGPSAQKSIAAASTLDSLSGSLTREQTGFAWGVLGYVQAKNQNFATALSYYNRADRSQLSADQFDWYARSALRLQRWNELSGIIRSMDAKQQKDPTWLYWLGRAMAAQGNSGAANGLHEQAAASGRNFYALLAAEELGQAVSTRNNTGNASSSDINRLARDGAIARALNLFRASQSSEDWNMRRQAQAEWRYAIRGFSEDALLAAAQLAYNNGFYEMAINTADSTNQQLNYNLRYISPFQDTVVSYANQVGIDPAWVYGLIRQESRFMMGARSGVGAHGLMQVMPATANHIAGKIGMDSSQLYTTDGNIRMGTWYMADTKASLNNSEVLATAGYNAGPSRARRWQDAAPMEAAIYAETIPFNETRDYVKKVMANTTYYASLLNEPRTSLKQRMGTIPPR